MDQISTMRNPNLALFAYELGHAPVMLELEARWSWEMAELRQGPVLARSGLDKEPAWPEEDSPFPVALARYLRVIQEAGMALVDSLPRISRDLLSKALSDAPERAWRAYEDAWLAPGHRAKIRESEAVDGGVDMLDDSPFVGTAWRDFRRAVQEFGDSLPEPLRTWGALGAHLAAVEGLMPPAFRQGPLPEQVSPAPFPVAADLLQKLKTRDPALDGLEPLGAEGWNERQKQARGLHEQILSRLDGGGEVAEGGLERWMTASQAVAVARGMGVPRSLSWIGKRADRQPAFFRSRRRGKRGRDVELVSFLAYLLEKYERASDEAAVPGKRQLKDHPRPVIRAEIEKREKQEHDERETRKEEANRARKKTPEERGDR